MGRIYKEKLRRFDGPFFEPSSQHKLTPSYHATLLGLSWLANYLIIMHAADIHTVGGYFGTALHVASHFGHVDAVRVLLYHGAHVNARYGTYCMPLHLASQNGQERVVELLLRYGADINARTAYLEDTPLYLAAKLGHSEVVQLLLGHGTDVHVEDIPNVFV